MEFIAAPSEPVWNRDEWLVHVPTNRVESLARIFHACLSRDAAKARLARRPKRFGAGLYEDILSGDEREDNAASRACSQSQQNGYEISGLDNNLFAIPGGRAYLIETTAAATLQVTGVPYFQAAPWKADAYNLRGFPVDGGLRPTFRDFFRPSPAHYR